MKLARIFVLIYLIEIYNFGIVHLSIQVRSNNSKNLNFQNMRSFTGVSVAWNSQRTEENGQWDYDIFLVEYLEIAEQTNLPTKFPATETSRNAL